MFCTNLQTRAFIVWEVSGARSLYFERPSGTPRHAGFQNRCLGWYSSWCVSLDALSGSFSNSGTPRTSRSAAGNVPGFEALSGMTLKVRRVRAPSPGRPQGQRCRCYECLRGSPTRPAVPFLQHREDLAAVDDEQRLRLQMPAEPAETEREGREGTLQDKKQEKSHHSSARLMSLVVTALANADPTATVTIMSKAFILVSARFPK